MIYFDNASTSFPKVPDIGKVLEEFVKQSAFNINRGNYSSSYKLEERVFEIREDVKTFFKADDDYEVVFTSGITEAINIFISGYHKDGSHILVSPMEHNAVMRTLEFYNKEGRLSYSIVDKEDMFSGNLKKYLKNNTTSIIVNHSSNVTGDVFDLSIIGRFAKENNLALMVDTAQSAGEIDIDIRENSIDYLAFTAHKGLLGLEGIGGAVISPKVKTGIKPLIYGGTGSLSDSFAMPDFYPDKLEAGTRNILGIIALGESLKYIKHIGLNKIRETKQNLRSQFLDKISNIHSFKYISLGTKETCSVLSFTNNKMDIASISDRLDSEYGICTRVGLQCSPLAHKTLNTFDNGGTLRFSFSMFNTSEEVDICINALKDILKV